MHLVLDYVFIPFMFHVNIFKPHVNRIKKKCTFLTDAEYNQNVELQQVNEHIFSFLVKIKTHAETQKILTDRMTDGV